MIQFREFSKNDWMGLNGAERFANGAEPLIAEMKVDGKDATVILDNQCLSILVSDVDEDGEPMDHEIHFDHGAATARLVATLRPEMTSAELEGGQL